jgi:parallel beta-helix repeat protein
MSCFGDNRAIDTFEDGFDVRSDAEGTILDGNVARGNAGVGIEVSETATDTQVIGNTAQDNGLDFCDEGTNTTVEGNNFGSTSNTCYVDEGV